MATAPSRDIAVVVVAVSSSFFPPTAGNDDDDDDFVRCCCCCCKKRAINDDDMGGVRLRSNLAKLQNSAIFITETSFDQPVRTYLPRYHPASKQNKHVISVWYSISWDWNIYIATNVRRLTLLYWFMCVCGLNTPPWALWRHRRHFFPPFSPAIFFSRELPSTANIIFAWFLSPGFHSVII